MKLILTGLFVVFVVHTVYSVCVPDTVENITLYSNNTLQWSEPANANACTVNQYLINVINNDDGTSYQYQGTKDSLIYDLKDQLDMCQTYIFEVHALSNESVIGASGTYIATTGPAENITLDLSVGNATSNATTQEIQLAWSLVDRAVAKCVAYYRVVYWTDNTDPTDTYVTTPNVSIQRDIPCSNYTLEVNAIVALPIIEGPIGRATVTAAGKVPSIPSIVSLTPASTTVDMVWKLESYAKNHCTLTTLNVYTLGVNGSLARTTVYIPDNVERDDVSVTVSGLTANYVYTALVSVTNVIGSSPNISITFQTTG